MIEQQPCEIAERLVLGIAILGPDALEQVASKLVPEDFQLASHRVVYRQMLAMLNSSEAIDPLTVGAALARVHLLDDVGGMSYLSSLEDDHVYARNLPSYIQSIKNQALKRRLEQVATLAAARSADAGADGAAILEELAAGLDDIRSAPGDAEARPIGEDVVPLLDRLHAERTRSKELLGLPTGLAGFDSSTRGLHAGEITVVGAATGVGKTALLLQIAHENLRNETPVLLFSLEMTRQTGRWSSSIRRLRRRRPGRYESATRPGYPSISSYQSLGRRSSAMVLRWLALITRRSLRRRGATNGCAYPQSAAASLVWRRTWECRASCSRSSRGQIVAPRIASRYLATCGRAASLRTTLIAFC